MSRLVRRVAVAEGVPPAVEERPPARLHPWAWWLWAIGAAIVVSLTDQLTVIVATAAVVVLIARIRRPAGRLSPFLLLAGFIVVARLLFRILLGDQTGGTVVLRLPELPLPDWAAGIQLGGPVTAEELLWTLQDASRLAAVVLAVGAASVLAEPRTTLRTIPAALHDLSTALVITLTVLPQLVLGMRRVQRARRLRGQATRGARATLRLLVPVLEDAVDSSMSLASSMECRGYGRTRDGRRVGRGNTLILLASLACLILGAFVLLGVPLSPTRVLGLAPEHWLAAALLALGAAAGVATLARAGRHLAVSRYRPPVWGPRAHLACATAGLAVAATATLPAPWGLASPALLALPALGKEDL
ncbi:CbiQ family ECF transporter T component [Tessaracoccus sp. OH4464_COT-324]|uniref:CbiQ family ECF transporter T component n=1 Tax=Tessaracoccus sp. OH4464_COT-324 TaxID=2491059 RepID=UPI000F634DE2|nr:CbiQ family ECF transporter T component [Tessaracoccus sp. OH4464_COT-324]RRD45227.1 energy-coupling factor transporter transmembrane protein EcfT [Tessaracoccus sp. OH4464_COT-324]